MIPSYGSSTGASRIKVVDYRVHFADGSSVKVMAHDRRTVDDLAAAVRSGAVAGR